MKKIFLLICCSISTFSFATNTDKDQIIELAKLYNKYMLVNEPSSGLLRKTRLEANDPLKATVKFITEACATNNKLLDKTFLTSARRRIVKVHMAGPEVIRKPAR